MPRRKETVWTPMLIGHNSQGEQQVFNCNLVSWMHKQHSGHCPQLSLKVNSRVFRKCLGIWWARTRHPCDITHRHSPVCELIPHIQLQEWKTGLYRRREKLIFCILLGKKPRRKQNEVETVKKLLVYELEPSLWCEERAHLDPSPISGCS